MSFRSGHSLFGAIGSAIMAGRAEKSCDEKRKKEEKEDFVTCEVVVRVRVLRKILRKFCTGRTRYLEVCPSHRKRHSLLVWSCNNVLSLVAALSS